MAVIVGSARSGGSNGKISGDAAGDQNKKEVSTQDYYVHSKGWRVFRAKDASKRKLIADAMRAACKNDKIGYDQSQRNTLYNLAAKVGFDPAKVTTACETDCSALVRVCCAYAGIKMSDFNTSSQASRLLASGAFTELTGDKYTKQSAYLAEGDILVTKTKGHTVVVLSSGSKVETETAKETTTSTGKKVKVTGGSVNIRTGPGTKYTAIHVANKGETFNLAEDDGWRPIEYGGHVYWISGNYSVVEG